ncbi:hypothetical protein D3C85_16270 [compost metagenome]
MNPLMLTAENTRKRFGNKAIGQWYRSIPGSINFVVPEGVTKISVAMVGGGGRGTYLTSTRKKTGQGGNIRYFNNITVNPGQILQVVVGNKGTDYNNTASSFGGFVSTNSTLGVHLGGGVYLQGSDGAAPVELDHSTSNYTFVGGNAGMVGRDGKGFDLKTGNWVLPTITQGRSGAPAGGGGGAQRVSSNNYLGDGASGAVRIIWGTGRAFPSTNVQDM